MLQTAKPKLCFQSTIFSSSIVKLPPMSVADITLWRDLGSHCILFCLLSKFGSLSAFSWLSCHSWKQSLMWVWSDACGHSPSSAAKCLSVSTLQLCKYWLGVSTVTLDHAMKVTHRSLCLRKYSDMGKNLLRVVFPQ